MKRLALFPVAVLVCVVLAAMAIRGRRKQRAAREKAIAERAGQR